METLHVATTINPRFDHVTPIESTHSAVTITHRCHVIAELLAVARSGLVDVVLVADEFEMLTLDLLHQLTGDNGSGPKVAAISDVEHDRDRLQGLGIPVASPQSTGAELVQWLHETSMQTAGPGYLSTEFSAEELQFLAYADPDSPSPAATEPGDQRLTQRRSGRRAAPYNPELDIPNGGEDGELGEIPVSRIQAPPIETSDTPVFVDTDGLGSDEPADLDDSNAAQSGQYAPATDEDKSTGHIVAVWGPLGSPGVTTIAVNMAVESALAGHRTLLIDANTYGAAIAVHLGLLDDTAAIAQACRTAEHRGIDAASLSGFAQHVSVEGTSLDVLTGLTRPERWPQLRARAWEQVLQVARDGWDQVIVDCGFGLEEDEELSFDIPAPQRNATTVTAVASADTVVAIGTGDPVGFARFMKSLEQLTDRCSTSVVPVINKVSAMTSGTSPKQQLQGVWDRFGPPMRLQHFMPWSTETVSAALLAGKSLAESAPKSDLRQSVRKLTVACTPAATAQRSTVETPRAQAWKTKIRRVASGLKDRVLRRNHGSVRL